MTLLATRARHAGLVAALLFSATLSLAAPAVPEGVRRIADLPYGQDERQRMDVYLPAPATGSTAKAPVIVMVHGGAWMGQGINTKVCQVVAHELGIPLSRVLRIW